MKFKVGDNVKVLAKSIHVLEEEAADIGAIGQIVRIHSDPDECGPYEVSVGSLELWWYKEEMLELAETDVPHMGELQSCATEVQIGGNHYSKYAIQPSEYSMKNNLNWCQGNVVKYITRYKDKNGMEDLKKAKHYIDLLIEIEFDNNC